MASPLNPRRRGLPALALLLAAAAWGQEPGPTPGLWKLSLESRVSTAPGLPAQPVERTECLSAVDLEDPERLLLGYGLVRTETCDITRREPGPGRLAFDMACPEGLGMSGSGEVRMTARTLDGTLDVRFAAAPRKAMQNRLHGEYQGECPGLEGGFRLDLP